MATPPDFSVGQVLTAAQMNAVGLWRVTSCTATFTGGTGGSVSDGVVTIGTNNTAITVSSAFSADFDNYRIILSNATASAGDNSIFFRPGGDATANYSTNGFYLQYTGATGSPNESNVTNGVAVGITSTTATSVAFDVFNPQKATWTFVTGGNAGSGFMAFYAGVHKVSTAYTSFVIRLATANFTGGTIKVYGYN